MIFLLKIECFCEKTRLNLICVVVIKIESESVETSDTTAVSEKILVKISEKIILDLTNFLHITVWLIREYSSQIIMKHNNDWEYLLYLLILYRKFLILF